MWLRKQVASENKSEKSGIWTHASEEITTLTWRLRPTRPSFLLWFVSISVDTSNDPDLQDIIEMLNSNRNKKRKFKPKIPATRNIKQRLNMITQSILNILTVQP